MVAILAQRLTLGAYARTLQLSLPPSVRGSKKYAPPPLGVGQLANSEYCFPNSIQKSRVIYP
jgi:hypothetical protein